MPSTTRAILLLFAALLAPCACSNAGPPCGKGTAQPCEPGHVCVFHDGEATCQQACESDDDCTEGGSCDTCRASGDCPQCAVCVAACL
jgi:hypothetical protein